MIEMGHSTWQYIVVERELEVCRMDRWPTLSGNSVGHSRCGDFHSVGRIQVDFGLKWKRMIDRSMDQLTIAVPSASEHGGGEEEELLQVFLTLYPAPALSF